MGIPDDTCVELEIDIQALLALSIELPGGVAIQAQLPTGAFPSLPSVVGSLMTPLTAAMTPLMPAFRILDTVISIVEFCKSVPDALGPPPNPVNVIKKLKKLLKAFAKLASLFPPISVPIMLVGVCKVIVAALGSLVAQLEHLVAANVTLDLARLKAAQFADDPELLAGAAALQVSIDCAQADVDLQFTASMSGLGPLNKFIDLLNAFAGLAGLPELVSLNVSGELSEVIDPLKAAVETLNSFCSAIPV